MDSHVPDIMTLRHSAAHLLAQAVKELYPDTTLTIGPATKEGFFYDLLPQQNFKEDDLAPIAQRMHELADKNIPLTHRQIPKDEARKLYAGNPFKLELINDIPGDTVGLAEQGNFYDLCKGGHVAHTGMLKHFKLQSISGSYWRADRANQPLQRISGVVFATAADLAAYEQRIEEAQKYDHRRLGKQLDMFSFHEEGPGFPFFHAHGNSVVQTLKDDIRKELVKMDYQEVTTPIMLSVDLWKQSGHFDHYKENMYFSEIEKQQYAIRPMNCPGAILVYKERPRSYRELPLRLAEFGHVHRNELSGVLHGLFRVRAFTQDDGHIFCAPESIEQEVFNTIELVNRTFAKFGFHDVKVYLSTKPANAMGDDALWQKATDALKHALERAHVAYEIQEGEGAFYGPKIEFHIQDSMGRTWQCGTVQLDFFQPERFELSYVSSAGTKERPVMIHRAIYGSMERFFGVLLEHFKGNLPFWLAPVQMKLLTITDEQKPYADELYTALRAQGYRIAMDESSDPLSGKIKTAQLERIPWMLVVGAKEVAQKTITLRYRDGKQEFGLSLDQLLAKAAAATKEYTV